MRLRPAESLSTVEQPSALREPDLSGPALKLSPSRELIFLRPGSGLQPGETLAEVLFQVDINQQGLNETVMLLKRADGTFLMSADDLERWRLQAPGAVPYHHEGKLYYPIGALPGAKIQANESRQTLTIETRPEAFAETVDVVTPLQYPRPILPSPGGFLNYNLAGTYAHDTQIQNGIFEVGFFNRYGVITSGVLAPELGQVRDWVRLDTTFTMDKPESRTSFRLGDLLTQPGAWGRPVRIGGIQYGTNFTTQPGFIRMPVLTANGATTLPSTVDVFVNNALVRRTTIPPGPFSIANIPSISGGGDVRVVVRDLLGREQILNQPFYGSAQLLKGGLDDFSYEAGLTRQDFGVASDHYERPAGAATYRRGLTDNVTAEARAEHSDQASVLGGSGVFRAGALGIASATYAASDSEAGKGSLAAVGVERITQTLSVSLQNQWTSSAFRQLGMGPDEQPRRRQSVLTAGYQFGALGAASATYIVQDQRGQPKAEVLTLAYSVPIGRVANFGLNLQHIFGDIPSNTLLATVVIPFGPLTTGSIGIERHSEAGSADTARSLFLQKSLPIGEGFGYRLQATESNVLGGLAAQTRIGTYTAEVSRTEDTNDTAVRLGAIGGIGTMGGYTFLARNMTDSFGIVRVADFPKVRVLQDNQVITRTDEAGYAVVPRLRPYDRNQITIDQRDLPFDATMGALRLDAVPYYRSGVLLNFPVQRVRAAVLTIVLEDGSAIPSGAVARVEGKDQDFPIALRGELYVEGMQTANRIAITWKNQACTIEVPYPTGDDPLPDLGSFVCKGVKP